MSEPPVGVAVWRDPNIARKAADSFARGDRCLALRRLCERQKTITSKRLLRIIAVMELDDILHAMHLRALADALAAAEYQPQQTTPATFGEALQAMAEEPQP